VIASSIRPDMVISRRKVLVIPVRRCQGQ